MQLTKNIKSAFMAIIISIACAVIFIFGLAFNAYAADGTEIVPNFYCTYTDAEGNQVCGRTLTAGTYDVSFYTENIDTISAMEITSTYDTSVITIGEVKNPSSTLTSMGSVTDNGNLVIGYVSDDNYAQVDPNGELISTVSMTFTKDCDVRDYIHVSTNPNLTFIVADSTDDNYDDEYALVESFEGYNGVLDEMSYDLAPALDAGTIEISGTVKIATDLAGTNGTYGLGGIDIVVGGEMVNGKLVGGEVVGTTNSTGTKDTFGNFKVTVPAGTTEIVFAKANIIYAKAVKLSGTDDISNAVIPVVMGDYNNDCFINTADRLTFNNAMIEYSVYADYNTDGIVNSADKMFFNNFLGSSPAYEQQSLD